VDRFELSGDGLGVSYESQGAGGVSHLAYEDNEHKLRFDGDQIRPVGGDLGGSVTVQLESVPDQSVVTFTLLVPEVHHRDGEEQVEIRTFGIRTLTRTGIAPSAIFGQINEYSIVELHGVAMNSAACSR
jgi:hypothetical protein